MKYNLSEIMTRAWTIYKKNENKKSKVNFAESLHRSWICAKAEAINRERVENAKAAAGITEETNTWYGWKTSGYEVMHGSKNLFGVDLIWGAKGDGAIYKARFFGRSQVQEATA